MGGELITDHRQATYRLKLEEARQDVELSRWRSAVDGAQLAVENAGKVVLALAAQIGRTHNPAPQIRRLIGEKRFNDAASKKLERLAELAELLGPDIHVQTDCGAEVEDRTPGNFSTEPTLTKLSPLRKRQ